MKNLSTVCFILLIIGCAKKSGHFISIKNESAVYFDSVRVLGAGVNFLIRGVPAGTEKKQSYFIKGEQNYESTFFAAFYSKDTVPQLSFGYFPNTQSVPYEMRLVVQKNLSIADSTKY